MPFWNMFKRYDCIWVRRRFSEYLDGALVNDDRVKIHDHVRTCEACSNELQGFSSTLSMIADYAAETLPGAIQTFRLPRSTFIEIFPTIHDDKPTLTFGIWVPYLSALVFFFMVLTTWISIERHFDTQFNSSNYVEVVANQ